MADRWAHFGSDRTLARFTLAVCRAQRRNGGQEVETIRRAGGRLFASYWADLYRLGGPQPLAEEWLALVAALRRRLAASPRAPLRVQLRLMGMAQALTLLPNGHPLIEPTLMPLFPPVDDSYGLPLLELSASFLVPLLRSPSPAGDRTRAIIRAALAELPADPARTDDPASLRVSVARIAVTSAGLPTDELASLLSGLLSLREPDQWIDPAGAIIGLRLAEPAGAVLGAAGSAGRTMSTSKRRERITTAHAIVASDDRPIKDAKEHPRGGCRQRRHGTVRPRRPAGEPSRRRVAVYDGAEEVEVQVDLGGETGVHQRIDVGF